MADAIFALPAKQNKLHVFSIVLLEKENIGVKLQLNSDLDSLTRKMKIVYWYMYIECKSCRTLSNIDNSTLENGQIG